MLSPERMHSLVTYDWPGNVRELRNLAERYVLLGESCTFDFENRPITDSEANQATSLPEKVEHFEKMLDSGGTIPLCRFNQRDI